MFQQNISTDDSIYYNHLKKKKRSMGRGKDESMVRLSPRVGSVNSYVVS